MPKAVVKKHIEDGLLNIIRLFKEEEASKDKLTYISLKIELPKLAMIELCCWIEDTQDKIVMRAISHSKIKGSQAEKFYKKYIKTNWSFSYKDFRKMLTHAIGERAVLDLEEKLAPEIQLLQSKLSDLKQMRDDYAHSHRPSIAAVKTPKHIYEDYFFPIFNSLKIIEDEILR